MDPQIIPLNDIFPDIQRTENIQVRWQDILELQITDPTLRQHVENFLDFLETAEFDYHYMDENSGEVSRRTLTGQDLLRRIAVRRETFERENIFPVLENMNITSNNKFVIRSHPRQPINLPQDGANTLFIGLSEEAFVPVEISLGMVYLRTAMEMDINGNRNPVTVEGVLANELAHLAFGSTDDVMSNMVESIIAVAMGAGQRDAARSNITFRRSGDYVSLIEIERRTASEPSLPAITAKPNHP